MVDAHHDEALTRLAGFFRDRQSRAGVVARQLLGTSHPDDANLTEQLIQERRRKTRIDGSVDGSLLATAAAAWELLELGCTRGHAGLDRMVGFLLGRQDQPGRFGEGCSTRRHEIAHCNHHLSGFFSPGSRDEAIAPLALMSDAVVATEFGARFAVSCIALRTVLRAGEERREPVRQHIDSLFLLSDRWQHGQFPHSLDLAFTAIAALGLAPPEYRDRLQDASQQFIAMQEDDGGWPGASFFHSLDSLLTVHTPEARAAIGRAVPKLLSWQRPNGGFDNSHDEEVALVALRTLRAHGARRPRRAPASTPARGR